MPMPADARRRRTPVAVVAAAATLLLCASCSKPEPPDTDQPPEPQATPATDRAAAGNATALRDTIRQPIDRAKAVEGQVEDAAAKQRAAVDAQAGY